ncbi:MAG: heavy-metal-associated domain-containing protein [Bacteroidales bacterium]|nr:heavy-metal-associated domain-containing protein [Bacteroidales bacterium]
MIKNLFVIISSILLLAVGGKDLRQLVLTPTPVMHCQSCEDKIKGNMRFEKGVVNIETDREKQTVTITYDPRKTNVETLQAAMKKIGRDTQVLSDKPFVKEKKQKK